jgi:hypothetical protein
VANFILSAAIRAVKSKMGTWVAYEAVRQKVPEISREQWAQAIGDAKAALSQRVLEVTRPLNRRPVQGEWTDIRRKSSANWWQHVEVHIRDLQTGALSTFHVTLKADTLRSRMSAMATAEARAALVFASDPDNYQVAIVQVEYAGTYRILPPG